MSLLINYSDGKTEEIKDGFGCIDLGKGEICYFLPATMTRYHALGVESYKETKDGS